MTVLRESPSGPLATLPSSTNDVQNDSNVAGANTSLALDTLETRMRVLEAYEVLDTFQGGVALNVASANVIGNVGDHSWSFIAAGGVTRTLGRPNSALNRLGRYTVSSGTSAITGIMLGSSGTPARGIGLLVPQLISVEWSAAADTTSGLNGKYRFGLGTNTSLTLMGSDGIFFEADDSLAGDFWRCIARKAGVQTTVVTAITYKPNGTYFKFGIFRENDGTVRFDLNDVTVATLAASVLPTTRIVAACQCQATINSGQAIEVDTCRLRYRRL